MTAPVSILDACDDPALFGPWFRDVETWQAWRAFLAALFGLPMGEDMLATYRQCTGRSAPPVGFLEAVLIVGRRGGKSLVLALVAVFLATFRDWRPYLAPGERATVMVIATDRKQARVIFRYILAFLEGVPMLAPLVDRKTGEAVDLGNRVSIEVHSASFRSTRGYTVVGALCDETAFWRSDDSANPDREILDALRPAMATVPGAMLLCASSPYARRGELWRAYRLHHGKDESPVLVWRADTRTMNPSVSERIIAEAYARDAASAAAEYGAEFRKDIESFVPREVVEACITPGVRERGRVSGMAYAAFIDPSGGSADSMTLAIGHDEERDGRKVAVLDAIRERVPPFSPEDVTAEFAELLAAYGIGEATGDRYAGEWPAEAFQRHGITYKAAGKPKSDLYRDMLPALNARQAELLDHPKLVAQLSGLERRTARGGRDSIDHGPGAHDDLANVVAGLVCKLTAPKPEPFEWYVSPPESPLERPVTGDLAEIHHERGFPW